MQKEIVAVILPFSHPAVGTWQYVACHISGQSPHTGKERERVHCVKQLYHCPKSAVSVPLNLETVFLLHFFLFSSQCKWMCLLSARKLISSQMNLQLPLQLEALSKDNVF